MLFRSLNRLWICVIRRSRGKGDVARVSQYFGESHGDSRTRRCIHLRGESPCDLQGTSQKFNYRQPTFFFSQKSNWLCTSVIWTKVAWIKSDSRAILAIHTHMVAHNPRMSVTHNGHNTWKLHLSNVQPNDSGTYMCQINTDPMKSQVYNPYIPH